jgi:hypothetical protein
VGLVGLVGLGGDGGEMDWERAKSARYRSSRCLLRYLYSFLSIPAA